MSRIPLMALAVVISALPTLASPVYYTFSGQVTSSQYAAITVGQTVSYTFSVDLDQQGYTITDSDVQSLVDDPSSGVDWFLADYVSGDAIAIDPAFAVSSESHYGFVQSSGSGDNSALKGSNADPSGLDFIWIAGNGNIADWTLGQGVTGQNQIASTTSPYSFAVNSNLTLTSINGGTAAAVPEPSEWVLFGGGLLGMAGFARRAKRG
jgi:hypothetical protein